MSQPDTRSPDGHLDDEALSAVLDGEAGAGAHLAACADCSARLGQLGAVARAVAAPVPPPPAGARDAAVARAMGAFGDDLVVDLARARAARRPARRWASLGAVAAVVLALLVAVPLLSGRDEPDDQVAFDKAGPAQDEAATAAVADLGAIDGDDQLRDVVRQRLGGVADTAAGGAESLRSAAPGSEGQEGTPAPLATEAAEDRSCVPSLGSEVPEGAVLAFEAPLTWKGAPAVALVYRSDERTTVYVLARDDCRILTFQRIATPTP